MRATSIVNEVPLFSFGGFDMVGCIVGHYLAI